MSKKLSALSDFAEKLRNDPERLKAFMRSVMGPPKRTLEGKEKEQVLLLLELIEPFDNSNNQHTWTDFYRIGETVYHVTYVEDEIILDEMLKEEE